MLSKLSVARKRGFARCVSTSNAIVPDAFTRPTSDPVAYVASPVAATVTNGWFENIFADTGLVVCQICAPAASTFLTRSKVLALTIICPPSAVTGEPHATTAGVDWPDAVPVAPSRLNQVATDGNCTPAWVLAHHDVGDDRDSFGMRQSP